MWKVILVDVVDFPRIKSSEERRKKKEECLKV